LLIFKTLNNGYGLPRTFYKIRNQIIKTLSRILNFSLKNGIIHVNKSPEKLLEEGVLFR
jgi:hypothetical protein